MMTDAYNTDTWNNFGFWFCAFLLLLAGIGGLCSIADDISDIRRERAAIEYERERVKRTRSALAKARIETDHHQKGTQ